LRIASPGCGPSSIPSTSTANPETPSMSFNPLENSVLVDDWTVSFDKAPLPEDKPNAVKRIAKGWDNVKSELEGLGGLKLVKPDFDALAETLVKSKTHAVMFELVLTKSEFRLDVEADKVTVRAGKVAVPSDLEDYRNFLATLNGWSTSSRNIVPDADFKKFNDNNPKKPPKPSYKDFEEMAKKSKTDVDAFRAWAKGNGNAKKAFEAIDKTAKAKPTDPARMAALKAINEALKDYYKTF
jgi:hypothetical protein